MLNNSSREADNTQLYLGYWGGGCCWSSLPLLEFVQPKKLKALLYKTEQGREESRTVCVTDPNEMRSDVKDGAALEFGSE